MSDKVRVVCELENAGSPINGVNFYPLEDGGMVSDEITRERADRFLAIPGYSIFDGEDEEIDEKPKKAAPKRRAKASAKPADDKSNYFDAEKKNPGASSTEGASAAEQPSDKAEAPQDGNKSPRDDNKSTGTGGKANKADQSKTERTEHAGTTGPDNSKLEMVKGADSEHARKHAASLDKKDESEGDGEVF